MSLQSTDLLIIERGGVQYQMTADQIADFVGAIRDYSAVDIAARNAGNLTPSGDIKAGDSIYVADASADADVGSGWAIYRVMALSPTVYEKVQEQEGMDVSITTNVDLSLTRTAAQATIVNSSGDDVAIPLADDTNAGLASPEMYNNSHAPASAGLTTASNPININTTSQSVTFGITQLTPLP